jgi:hypothetical protein
MSTCKQDAPFLSLELPTEFEDMTGLIHADLRAIVGALAERASQRLLLSRRETQQLRRSLWNNLTQAVNQTIEPLSAERR